MILFINACVRRESRTKRLADLLLSYLHDEVETVDLNTLELPFLTEEAIDERTAAAKAKALDHPLCRNAAQFAQADTVVIAAPFWDLSFPSVLKRYLESICVTGVTFVYSNEGIPISRCRAKKLYYLTTAGGPLVKDFGFDYVKALCGSFMGVEDCVCFFAENLDIWGTDVEAVMTQAEQKIREYFE